MDDKEILGHIDELIQTEHELRAKVADGTLSSDEEQAQLRSVEESLDQCWDLLRQRRARREFGEDPGDSRGPPGVRGRGVHAVAAPGPAGRAAPCSVGSSGMPERPGPDGRAGLSSVRLSGAHREIRQRRRRRLRRGRGDPGGWGRGRPVRPARPPLAVIAELRGHPFSPGKGGVQFTGETYPLAEVRLLAPVLPSKVVAVGGNYAGHAREIGAEPGARRPGSRSCSSSRPPRWSGTATRSPTRSS